MKIEPPDHSHDKPLPVLKPASPAAPAKPAAPKGHGRVFDVMRPGKAPANASSKPVILDRKHQVKDLSVSMSGIGESKQMNNARQKIAITAHEEETPPAPTPPEVPAAPVTHNTPDPAPAAPLVTEAWPDLTPAQQNEDIALAKVAMDAMDTELPSLPNMVDVPEDILAIAAAEQPLPTGSQHPKEGKVLNSAPGTDDEKQFFIAQHSPHHTSVFKVVVLLFVIVLLAALAADLVLDTLDVAGVPHTTFFSTE